MSFSVIKYIFAVGFVALASAGVAKDSRIMSIFPNGRIVGGEETTIEENPWQASLQVYGFAYCGATIVSSEWIVTAAHCTNYPVSYVTVKVGSKYKTQGGSSHPALMIVKHEDYRTNRYGIPENDVAVVKVATPFEFDATRRPIGLFEQEEESVSGILSIITGWGDVKEGGSSSEVLQIVKVPIVSKDMCHEAYKSYGGLPEGQTRAAHPKGGKDARQGDSGGPLTIDGRPAGIVSRGNGRARPGHPGVHTEAATYSNWIAFNAEL